MRPSLNGDWRWLPLPTLYACFALPATEGCQTTGAWSGPASSRALNAVALAHATRSKQDDALKDEEARGTEEQNMKFDAYSFDWCHCREHRLLSLFYTQSHGRSRLLSTRITQKVKETPKMKNPVIPLSIRAIPASPSLAMWVDI